jgi:hypothetical protein
MCTKTTYNPVPSAMKVGKREGGRKGDERGGGVKAKWRGKGDGTKLKLTALEQQGLWGAAVSSRTPCLHMSAAALIPVAVAGM